ncbi:hypothetical protein DFJ74DRAFT_658751 [Hyaloraphidium curvatum]|nr:hypothetical protein DFJ74DRAFT_658751 [Hyaloraphidium curvatum]
MAAEARRKQEAEAEARRRRDEDLAHEREKLELQRRRTELEHEAKAKELALLAERLKLEKELAELNIRTAPPPSPGTPGGLSPHGAYEILPADLERGKYLGSGAFGEVFEGLYQKHTRVAMKLVKMAGTPRLLERKRADFEQEMTVWGALPYHDNGALVPPCLTRCR